MNARHTAYNILLRFEAAKARLEDLLNETFAASELSDRERKFAYHLCSGVVRFRSNLDWKIKGLYHGSFASMLDKFKVILRLAIYEIDRMDFIPPHATVNEYVQLAKKKLPGSQHGVVNGILRSYLREKGRYNPRKKFKSEKTQISVEHAYPEWMIERWLERFGVKQTRQLCESMNERPLFDLRINTARISIEDFLKKLSHHGVGFERSGYFDHFIKTPSIQKIHGLGLFSKGFCSVQDESSYMVAKLVNAGAGDIFLDACAAPGGKYTAVLQDTEESVPSVAMDNSRARLAIVEENIKNLRIESGFLILGDATIPPFQARFTKILVDAPCSGHGTIQKNPDIKWRREPGQIREFQALQLDILDAVAELLLPGGELIYATCTIEAEENEQVVERFLGRQQHRFATVPLPAQFAEITANSQDRYLRTYPHVHKMDGAFACKLTRIK